MLADDAARHAAPRFFALPPLSPGQFADFPALADLVAFAPSLDPLPSRRAYRGRGSDAWPVDRLLVLALSQLHRRQPSPADWHRQARCHLGLAPQQAGRVPARSTLYAFRDRLAGPLERVQQARLARQRPEFPCWAGTWASTAPSSPRTPAATPC